ncbi:MAG: isoaspartyl peptidase/L-asparaginase, partial [Bacteroidota bacterium]
PQKAKEYALVIHGGAGTITKANLKPNQERAYREKLTAVLEIGDQMLKEGKSSEEVVVRVISLMENSPLFNAGKGSVFNAEGKQDMDASIMRGDDLNCGAIAGVSNVKNPIKLARMVMDSSEHVFLARKGAEQFAQEMQLDIVDPDYFFDQKRYDRWKKLKDKEVLSEEEKHGTVGAVCLDKSGNLCAGTSTGGMTYKKWGRIGDSPVIGAGTYANNESCGVSSTGHGEFFIRAMVAHQIAAAMEYGDYTLEEAANLVIHEKLQHLGGTGGVIAMDKFGNVAMPFNTEGMYRGYVTSDSEPSVAIYK